MSEEERIEYGVLSMMKKHSWIIAAVSSVGTIAVTTFVNVYLLGGWVRGIKDTQAFQQKEIDNHTVEIASLQRRVSSQDTNILVIREGMKR